MRSTTPALWAAWEARFAAVSSPSNNLSYKHKKWWWIQNTRKEQECAYAAVSSRVRYGRFRSKEGVIRGINHHAERERGTENSRFWFQPGTRIWISLQRQASIRRQAARNARTSVGMGHQMEGKKMYVVFPPEATDQLLFHLIRWEEMGRITHASRAIGFTYWLKISDSVNAKLNTVNPFARSAKGRISTV